MSLGGSISAADARVAAERADAVLARDPRVQLVFLFGSAVDSDRRERAVARVLGDLFAEMIRPVVRERPDLPPAGMDEP